MKPPSPCSTPRPARQAPGLAAQRAPSWKSALRQRVGTLWWLKATGTCLYMWLFFRCYFYLLEHHAYAVTVMPETLVDALVPFLPGWVLVYFSLWVYVALPGALQKDWPQLFRHGLGALAMCAIGLGFYYFFPTTFVPPPIDWQQHPLGRILASVDKPGNAFPSMHVAYAVFAWTWLRRELRDMAAPRWLSLLNGAWCTAIAFSTLATKQHVWWDVVAGTALGLCAGTLTTRLSDAAARPASRST